MLGSLLITNSFEAAETQKRKIVLFVDIVSICIHSTTQARFLELKFEPFFFKRKVNITKTNESYGTKFC